MTNMHAAIANIMMMMMQQLPTSLIGNRNNVQVLLFMPPTPTTNDHSHTRLSNIMNMLMTIVITTMFPACLSTLAVRKLEVR
jgi:mannitol/fructose-specific phosphotransferase system IIA component (Ntr-type)